MEESYQDTHSKIVLSGHPLKTILSGHPLKNAKRSYQDTHSKTPKILSADLIRTPTQKRQII